MEATRELLLHSWRLPLSSTCYIISHRKGVRVRFSDRERAWRRCNLKTRECGHAVHFVFLAYTPPPPPPAGQSLVVVLFSIFYKQSTSSQPWHGGNPTAPPARQLATFPIYMSQKASALSFRTTRRRGGDVILEREGATVRCVSFLLAVDACCRRLLCHSAQKKQQQGSKQTHCHRAEAYSVEKKGARVCGGPAVVVRVDFSFSGRT